ncbi:MAG: hypothetical protein ACT4ON_00185 [Bacteroidota bacterium]
MKNGLLSIVSFLLISILFPGCEIVEGIFRVGVWTGIILVLSIIILIIYLMKKMDKNK